MASSIGAVQALVQFVQELLQRGCKYLVMESLSGLTAPPFVEKHSFPATNTIAWLVWYINLNQYGFGGSTSIACKMAPFMGVLSF